MLFSKINDSKVLIKHQQNKKSKIQNQKKQNSSKLISQMLIQEIIRKQTISILDKILQASPIQKQKKHDQQTIKSKRLFTIQQYVDFYQQKNVIKPDQKQILLILLTKHLQDTNKQGKIDEDEGNRILNEIKKSILQQKEDQKNINKVEALNKNQSSPNDLPQIVKMSRPGQQDANKRQSTQLINKEQINKISLKLKKQNQFIMRNIDRIKKYATNVDRNIIDYERFQLQEIKISHEISHKLFHYYKPIYPAGMGTKEALNFQSKEQYKSTLNYHKILEIFNDASIKLEIQNKLALLRFIKKFSFNQNFIQLEEWVKIYRAIINNLGVKQVLLQRLVRDKEDQKKNIKFVVPCESRVQKASQMQYRTRRIKTEASIPEPRYVSMGNIIRGSQASEVNSRIDNIMSKSGIKPLQTQQKNEQKSYNPNQYRTKHKKLLKNVHEVQIKIMKKDLRLEKMIGLGENKKQERDTNTDQIKSQHSYLKKAIKGKKLGKITWESLFNMNEQNIHYNIVIPDFAKNLIEDDF